MVQSTASSREPVPVDPYNYDVRAFAASALLPDLTSMASTSGSWARYSCKLN